ncbi:MAG: DUF397 domain-containing protein, partial [Actinoplanes sp.]
MEKPVVDLTEAIWRRSARSTGEGVEVAVNIPGVIAVRDSRRPDGPALIFTPREWEAFVGGAQDGEF